VKNIVFGSSGLVGSSILRQATELKLDFKGLNTKNLDLTKRGEVFDFFERTRPRNVILAAAKVGGIYANASFPVEFLSLNIQIQTNVMDAAHAVGVDRLVFLGSSCIYPKHAPQPLKEEYLLSGPLEETNSAYAIAKIAGVHLVKSYRKEYGHRWISLMPTNLYGPNDNFDLDSSHVVPAMIRKFVDATRLDHNKVELWGSGNPRREFMHVDDFAKAVLHTLHHYDSDQTLNVGTGYDISISELASTVARLSGFRGNITWDSSKPDGVPRKVLDVSRLAALGYQSTVTLEEGLYKTIKWYRENYQ
jgi:GDP-L-fucose synthase